MGSYSQLQHYRKQAVKIALQSALVLRDVHMLQCWARAHYHTAMSHTLFMVRLKLVRKAWRLYEASVRFASFRVPSRPQCPYVELESISNAALWHYLPSRCATACKMVTGQCCTPVFPFAPCGSLTVLRGFTHSLQISKLQVINFCEKSNVQ